jgi:zinc protease
VPASERGFLQTTRLDSDSYHENLELFAGDTAKALGLIAEQTEWVRVYWPSVGFSRWLETETRRYISPAARAYREFRSALFGQHAYHLLPTPAAVRTVTGEDLQDWLRRIRRPKNGALVIVGDIDIDAVSASVENSLRNWKGDQTPVATPPAPLRSPGQGESPRILFTKATHRRSTEVRFGCVLPPIQALTGAVRSDALAALIHEDLAHRLRSQLGASYGSDVRASTLRGGTAFLEGTLDVEDGALPEALDTLNGWLDPAREIPLKPTALERERRRMARRRVFNDAINSQVAVDLFRAWNLGWPLATLDEYPNALARMTLQDLAADLETCRASAVISVLGNSAPPPGASPPL